MTTPIWDRCSEWRKTAKTRSNVYKTDYQNV